MFQVLACITQQHHPWLVLLAGAVCGFGAWVSLNLVARAAATSGRARYGWLAAGATATGGGVWATHFIAMLSFRSSLPIGYDLVLTGLSIVVAVVGSGVGIAVGIGRRRYAAAAGGAIVGAAVGAMHYTGMAALRAPADLVYDGRYVAASLLIGVPLGAAAMAVALRRPSIRRRAAASALLAAAICGLHFTGMTAAALVPDPLLAASGRILASEWLAVAVAATATLIMALSLVGSIVDQRLADRTAREAARLRASEERFRQLADATSEGIVIHRDGLILDANRAIAAILGHPPQRLVDRCVLDFVAAAHRNDVRSRIARPTFDTAEIDLLHADGTPIAVEVQGQMITHDGVPARVVAIRDIRERRQAEERIRHMANHDVLTGLPNRVLFHDRTTVALANASRDGHMVALLYVDLDRFKSVNDLLGHQAGDLLLEQVAQRLTGNLRRHDTAARLSGDEFVILQDRIAQPGEAMALAERLVKAFAVPFDLAGQQMVIGASVGIALFPQDGNGVEQLLLNADTALYRAKSDGRGTFRFFEAAMDEHLQSRRRLEHDLRRALAADALHVHYQPLLACDTHSVLGFEALVRWHHPERGLISPAEFIPLAEETGLIMALGEWVLRSACRDAAAWPDTVHVAVNLSPVQFRLSDVASLILSILDEAGLPPHRLEIEITEGVLIDDTERVVEVLSVLKAAGVRIALDDFGTGYSSLSYLQKFAFDKLKIDRSFVSGMEDNRQSRSIVRSIITLARSLGITVTAEGVETCAQFQLLKHEACDQVQGFLIGRPAPIRDLDRFLAAATRPLPGKTEACRAAE
ncbi:EAL domain-containing protein [Azospirillum sp. ST 5-10]|uniref:EAL domain-containing protein n=1 Tax=unclassified Azospirillum TaxID=2630922 RepID=UPI003F4A8177